MHSLIEYLYIDHKRLDSYFEQIASSPVAYDKVPTWKTGIGVTSLGVEGSQSMVQRPFTTHEKVNQLLEYLEKGNHLLSVPRVLNDPFTEVTGKLMRKLYTELSTYSFHLIEAEVRKLFIPGRDTVAFSSGITMWVTDGTGKDTNNRIEEQPIVYLFQDTNRGDSQPVEDGFTAYSRWEMLIETISGERKNFESENSNLMEMQKYSCGKRSFFKDSESFGIVVSGLRKIRSLYRVRKLIGTNLEHYICGYPVFIIEA